MSANVFDQFDEAQPAPQSTSAGNLFDQFDASANEPYGQANVFDQFDVAYGQTEESDSASAQNQPAGDWSSVASGEAFQKADWQTRQKMRADYFNQEVRPNTPADKLDDVQSEFFTRTGADVFGGRETQSDALNFGYGGGLVDQRALEARNARQPERSIRSADNTSQDIGGDKGSVLTDFGNLLAMGADRAALNTREVVRKVFGEGVVASIDRADEWLNGQESEALLSERIERNESELTPETIEAREKAWWDSEKGELGPAWSDWRSYFSGITESIPETAMTMAPSMMLSKGVYAWNMARGVAPKLAAKRAATTATLAGGLSEGLLGGGASSREVRDSIQSMPEEQLRESGAIQSLMSEGGLTFEQARDTLAEDASSQAFVTSAVITGAFGGLGDRTLARIITDGPTSRIGAALRGAVGEGVFEEMPQEAGQQASENLAMRRADGSVGVLDDVPNAALGGLAIGASMGAGMGVAAGGESRLTNNQESQPLEEGRPVGPRENSSEAEFEQRWREHERENGLEPIDLLQDTGTVIDITPNADLLRTPRHELSSAEREARDSLAYGDDFKALRTAAEQQGDAQAVAELDALSEEASALLEEETLARTRGDDQAMAPVREKLAGVAQRFAGVTEQINGRQPDNQQQADPSAPLEPSRLNSVEGLGGESAGQLTEATITQARRVSASQGGDALDQTLAGEVAEQMAMGQASQPEAMSTPAIDDLPMRMDAAAAELDQLAQASREAGIETSSRQRRLSLVLNRAEAAYQKGNTQQAERIFERAAIIANNLRQELQSLPLAQSESGSTPLQPVQPEGQGPVPQLRSNGQPFDNQRQAEMSGRYRIAERAQRPVRAVEVPGGWGVLVDDSQGLQANNEAVEDAMPLDERDQQLQEQNAPESAPLAQQDAAYLSDAPIDTEARIENALEADIQEQSIPEVAAPARSDQSERENQPSQDIPDAPLTYRANGQPFPSERMAMMSGVARRAQAQEQAVEAVPVEGGFAVRVEGLDGNSQINTDGLRSDPISSEPATNATEVSGTTPVSNQAAQNLQYRTNGAPFPSKRAAMMSGFARNAQRNNQPVAAVPVEGGFALDLSSRTPPDSQEASQPSGPQPHALQYRTNGRPFSTPREAMMSRFAREAKQNNQTAKPVRVDGGFALEVRAISNSEMETEATPSQETQTAIPQDSPVDVTLSQQPPTTFTKPTEMNLVRNENGQVNFQASVEQLGPVPDGFTRLYRASSPTVKFSDVFEAEGLEQFRRDDLKGVRYTNDPNYAEYYRSTYGRDAKVDVLDVRNEDLEGRAVTDYEFVIDDGSITDQSSLGQKVSEGDAVQEIAEQRAQADDFTGSGREQQGKRPWAPYITIEGEPDNKKSSLIIKGEVGHVVNGTTVRLTVTDSQGNTLGGVDQEPIIASVLDGEYATEEPLSIKSLRNGQLTIEAITTDERGNELKGESSEVRRQAPQFSFADEDGSQSSSDPQESLEQVLPPANAEPTRELNGTPNVSDVTKRLSEYPALSAVRVVQSVTELPPHVLASMDERDIDAGKVTGAYDPTSGESFVVADNLMDAEEGVRRAVHEAVAHQGVRGVLGSDLNQVMMEVYRSYMGSKAGQQTLREVRSAYPFLDVATREGRLGVAEELVARVVENASGRSKLRERVVATIRRALRTVFPDVAWTDADVRALGSRARRYMEARQALQESGPSNPGETLGLQSVVRGEGSVSGVEVDEAQRTVDEFIREYNGNLPLKVRVSATQEELYGPQATVERVGRLKGAYHPSRKVMTVVAGNATSKSDIQRTLRHEVLGHYGLNTFTQSEKRALLDRILETQNSTSMARVWDEVRRNYADASPDIQAEEVFANIAEVERGALGEAWGRVLSALQRTLRRSGMIKRPLSHSELHDLARRIGEGIREGRRPQQVFPESDQAQFSRETPREDEGIRFSLKSEQPESVAGPYDPNDSTGFSLPDESLLDVALRRGADKMRPLLRLRRAIQQAGGNIEEEADPYLTEELYHGRLENDLDTLRNDYVEPLAQGLAKAKISQADLDEYVYALHAPERNAVVAERNPNDDTLQDGGSGMSNAEAADIIDKVERSGKKADYQRLAKIVQDITAVRRDAIRDGGLETDDVLDAWDATYENYVPLKGFSNDEPEAPRIGKGFQITGKESFMVKGRRDRAASPSTQAIVDANIALIRRRKNEVGNAFLSMVTDHPNPTLWEVFTDDNPDTETSTVRVSDPETGEKRWEVRERAVQMGRDDRYFKTKRAGRTYYIKVKDQRLLNAMRNVGPESNGWLIRTAGAATRVMSSMMTSLNPEFLVTNFERDIQTALLNVGAEQTRDDGKIKGQRILKDTARDVRPAMRAAWRGLSRSKASRNPQVREWDQWFQEFIEDGAKTGYFDLRDIDAQAKEIAAMVRRADGTTMGHMRRFGRKTADLVENVNGAVENAVRLSSYVNARRNGLSRRKAASLAKNLTVNFNRRGEIGTALNAAFMFANASIQGTMNFARVMVTLKDTPKGSSPLNVWNRMNLGQKIGMGMASGAFALALLNRWLSDEDDDGVLFYDKIPDHVKERHYVLMTGWATGNPEDYIKIPLPYGYNVFAVAGTHAESVMAGTESPAEAAKNLGLAVVGSFSPIGWEDSESLSGIAAKNLTPTLVRSITQLGWNEDFAARPIYQESFPFGAPKPASSLSFRSTPEAYQTLTRALNDITGGTDNISGVVDINPDVIQHLVNYYGGGAWGFVEKTADFATRSVSGQEIENYRIPFAGRVLGSVTPYPDQQQFYERRDELWQMREEADSLKGREGARYRMEHRDELRLFEQSKATAQRLTELRKMKDQLEANERLSDEARRMRVERIEDAMKQHIDRFNRLYNEALSPELLAE